MYDRSYLNLSSEPLGIRNNNPGNVEKTSSDWVGKLKPSQHERFEQFKSIGLGIRAMLVDLRTKINSGLNTPELIIYRWAPPSENNTEAYIKAVVEGSGIPRKQPLDRNEKQQIMLLARAMAKHETGKDLDKRFFETGWELLDSGKARIYADSLNLGGREPENDSKPKTNTKWLLSTAAGMALLLFVFSPKK
jgi:hypothetical protein